MSKFLLSPMPGLLVDVAVQPGQKVQAGEKLAVIEAMKMENILIAAQDGVVGEVWRAKGESLAVDQVDRGVRMMGPAIFRRSAVTLHRHVSRQRQRAAPRPWTVEARRRRLLDLPFNDSACIEAQTVHRAALTRRRVQLPTLLSIKTGGCPEDCGYCPQAARYHTGVEAQRS